MANQSFYQHHKLPGAELPLLSAYAEQHAAQGLAVLGFSLDSADTLRQVKEVAQSLRFPVGLLSNSSAPGYGRIWHIPVNFTIDRQGRLIDSGWQDKQPTWTQERLGRIVTPLLNAMTTAK
jgi:cytochrome c biogenesis protein CcmG, thiol:disulfide interchange protein DsbE